MPDGEVAPTLLQVRPLNMAVSATQERDPTPASPNRDIPLVALFGRHPTML